MKLKIFAAIYVLCAIVAFGHAMVSTAKIKNVRPGAAVATSVVVAAVWPLHLSVQIWAAHEAQNARRIDAPECASQETQ